MSTRIAFNAALRAAAVDLLREFGQDAALKLQVYPGRPRSINPPTAFVDRMRETISFDALRRRVVQVDIVVIHGLFDSAEAVSQRDAFVDRFVDWVTDRFHAAGAETALEPRSVEDDPNFVPDWIVPGRDDRLPLYFATTITLEGEAR